MLEKKNINCEDVIVFRHRPIERELRKIFPWLASEEPDLYNTYQRIHGVRVEKALEKLVGRGYVASFIGMDPGRAEFVGLYAIVGVRPLSMKQYWSIPDFRKLKEYGMLGWVPSWDRKELLYFDLKLLDFYQDWKGRLVIGWPGLERSWWRRAHKNDFPILAIREESAFCDAMPPWIEINLSWEELKLLPLRWRTALSQWRAVYYIYDTRIHKGYVGSAYGKDNLLGRWLNYAAIGHGGNKLLRSRNPKHFRFSILERVSPDMEAADVIRLESTWKERLHSRIPEGLNDN